MKTIPYWIETAGAFPDRSGKPLTEDTDLVVVGAGLTGLSTALHSARKGARVTLVEKGQIGSGASARNGGMANLGFTIGVGQAIRRYGLERAREIYNSYGEAVDTVERLVHEESIDCQFRRVGRLGVASRPAHFESKKAQQRLLAKHFGHETTLIGKSELRSEIGSDAYHGGLLDPFSAALHVGRFVRGMAEACERAGVEIHERNAAIGVRRTAMRPVRGQHRARCHPCRAGHDGHRRLHRQELPVAAPTAGLRGQLHHRHRTARRGARPGHHPQGPPHRRLQQGLPLLPAHPGQPAAVRRPCPLRTVRPHLGQEERGRPVP